MTPELLGEYILSAGSAVFILLMAAYLFGFLDKDKEE